MSLEELMAKHPQRRPHSNALRQESPVLAFSHPLGCFAENRLKRIVSGDRTVSYQVSGGRGWWLGCVGEP